MMPGKWMQLILATIWMGTSGTNVDNDRSSTMEIWKWQTLLKYYCYIKISSAAEAFQNAIPRVTFV